MSESDLSIVIGKRGSNAKLTSRLLGWKLDIAKEASVEIGLDEKVAQAADSLSNILPHLSAEKTALLAQNGLVSAEAFEDVEAHELVEMGFDAEEAEKIINAVREYQSQ